MKRQDKVGVVMKDGEQLIPCEYDSISSWWEYGPSAHYVVKDKKVGIIDYIGKVLLPTEYDSLDYVTKDVVIVTKDSKYGAVDINNRLVLPYQTYTGWRRIAELIFSPKMNAGWNVRRGQFLYWQKYGR